jgi:peptide methionine sulfoxide reductase msrA/msrB
MKIKLLSHSLNQFSLILAALLFTAVGTQCLAQTQAPPPPSKSAQNKLKAALAKDKKTLLKVAEEVLSPLEYKVAFKSGTERAFKNRYWKNKAHGIYVDVISGEPLFSSAHKFKSGTGWPSFDRPLSKETVVEVVDKRHGMKRIEVKSKASDIHLGHVFEDGPKKTTGRRFCINSASLRFVPLASLEEEGYKELLEDADLMSEFKKLEGESGTQKGN